ADGAVAARGPESAVEPQRPTRPAEPAGRASAARSARSAEQPAIAGRTDESKRPIRPNAVRPKPEWANAKRPTAKRQAAERTTETERAAAHDAAIAEQARRRSATAEADAGSLESVDRGNARGAVPARRLAGVRGERAPFGGESP